MKRLIIIIGNGAAGIHVAEDILESDFKRKPRCVF